MRELLRRPEEEGRQRLAAAAGDKDLPPEERASMLQQESARLKILAEELQKGLKGKVEAKKAELRNRGRG